MRGLLPYRAQAHPSGARFQFCLQRPWRAFASHGALIKPTGTSASSSGRKEIRTAFLVLIRVNRSCRQVCLLRPNRTNSIICLREFTRSPVFMIETRPARQRPIIKCAVGVSGKLSSLKPPPFEACTIVVADAAVEVHILMRKLL